MATNTMCCLLGELESFHAHTHTFACKHTHSIELNLFLFCAMALSPFPPHRLLAVVYLTKRHFLRLPECIHMHCEKNHNNVKPTEKRSKRASMVNTNSPLTKNDDDIWAIHSLFWLAVAERLSRSFWFNKNKSRNLWVFCLLRRRVGYVSVIKEMYTEWPLLILPGTCFQVADVCSGLRGSNY